MISPPIAGPQVNAVEVTGSHAWKADVLTLFQQLLPAVFFCEALRQARVRQNNCIYTNAVVIWLMIAQRLQGGTLETAVLELLRGLPATFWPQPCKRLQRSAGPEGPKLSSNTGAFNQARQELLVSLVEQAYDRVFGQLSERMTGVIPEVGERVFFVDGTAVRLAHREKLRQMYPPAPNQHGESHWPLIRMLVVHDLYTGLALRPVWGPMHGNDPVSEQGLLERLIDRLPALSVLLGDSNFGVFSVAYAADQRSHPVAPRSTVARAQHLYGGPLRDGIDQRIQWKPSRDDRKSHPGLPAEASVSGRLIVREVQPSNGAPAFLLAVFTTLEIEAEAVIQLYGNRWNIEVDLRSLKDTLLLDQLTCTTPEMVAKEMDLAMMAYNLVRAVTYQAAQQAGLPPRAFSFTRVRNVLNAFLPGIAAAQNEQQAQQRFEDMMYYVRQARLPKRTRQRRSYPRAAWPKPKSFPSRHG